MLYLYQKEAGKPQITLLGDEHRYIFKVRRHKVDESIYLRNLEDGLLYRYLIVSIDKQSAILELQESQTLQIKAKAPLHIGWCVIDPKNIEKVLPTLNEMGVEKITFIYCKRSQKSFKPDFKRWEKILLNSSQQSGRSVMMQLDEAESLKAFIAENPQSHLLDFSEHTFSSEISIDTIVVGCEGGMTEDEIALFAPQKVIGLETPLVLKSESAVCAVAAKILL